MTVEKPKSMVGKIGGLLSSLRFWQLTVAAAVAAAAQVGAISEDVARIVVTWLGAVVAVGSADSIAEKIAARKPTH